jgi:protein-S-isoprenylcysteine O-methyltransferase Ste14
MDELNQKEKLGIKLILKSLSVFLVFILITFLAAGRLDYWQGWVFNGLNIFFILLTFLVLRDQKDLIKERLQPGKGMKQWDRIYYMVSTPLFFVMFILSILDGARFAWEPTVPFIIMLVGIILYSIGQIIILWAKKTNRFFSSVVRIQADRKHEVCTTGPYRFVRHPGYLSGLIFTIGTPLMLGSFWGLLPAIATILLMCGRTYLEDTTLKNELPGYRDYSKKVRYRIIPFLW